MSPDGQREAIAEACGWKSFYEASGTWGDPPISGWIRDGNIAENTEDLPDYVYNQNAIEEAKTILTGHCSRAIYINTLADICRDRDGAFHPNLDAHFAPARFKAEAFLKTLGLWKEAQP